MKNPMNINSQSFLRQTSGLDLITREKIEEFSLRINHKNGRYDLPIYGKYDVKSLIDYLGLDMSDIDQEAIYVSPLDNLIEKVDYELMNYVAKKFNTVTFKSPINDLISVNISGSSYISKAHILLIQMLLYKIFMMWPEHLKKMLSWKV